MKSVYLIIFGFIFLSCGRQERTTPQIASISESVYASGMVKARGQYDIVSEVNGIIDKIHVEEGDTVKEGALLFTIDNTSAKLETENARLAMQLAEQERQNLENLRRELTLAKENYQQDSLLYERQKKLWEENIGTKLELEQRKLAKNTAKTNYQNLLVQYRQKKEQVDLNVEQARNQLKILQEQQENFQIRSMIDGKVFSIIPEEGESVTAYSTIALLGNPDEYTVEVQVDEIDIVRIKNGQEIFVVMDSYRDSVFVAEVNAISPVMNQETGTFTVEGRFINSPPRLYPNLTLEANILIQAKDSAMVIPREYLEDENYVLDKNGERIPVKTGLKSFEYVEILDGITGSQYIYKP